MRIILLLCGVLIFCASCKTSKISSEKTMIQVLLENLAFPEGPAIDSKGNIWFVELHGGNVCVLSPDGNLKRYAIANGKPNGIAIDDQDNIWFCDSGNDCISVLDSKTGELKTICNSVDGERLNNPNDLAFDSRGNVIFTCPGNSRKEPTGYVCAVNKEGVKKIITEKFFPNGLAVSPDGKTLVLAETYQHRLWKGDWNAETLEWTNASPWVEVGGTIGPDGMAFGDDGNLYVAIYGGKAVKVVSPAGEIIRVLELDGNNASNCAFLKEGGLLVTETEKQQLLKIKIDTKPARLFQKTFEK
ncbi:MAG: SMP-30/gluconolactonase/LRE family protein [Opitutales bacterium]|nr:SMP-30/gluconolactonase/LRE family protein [Opitutales bacterium]